MLAPAVIFAVAVAVKIALARMLPGPWLFSDSTLYAHQATEILRRGFLALREGVQDYTILYPLVLAPAFLAESRAEAHQVALVLNAIISTSTVFPFYWIARRMLPAWVSVLLTAVTAFLPSLFVYSLALSSENLFLPLFWWGTFFLMRLSENDRASDALAAGLAIGLLPAVKLTGFAILAAGAVMAVGMAGFHKVDRRRAAILLIVLVLPQLVWLLLRGLLGSAERGLFGFGPGVGESLVSSLARFDSHTWRAFFGYFLNETTYFLVGAYVAWIAFSVYLIWQYRTWRARSREGFLLLWTFLSALALVLVTVVFLFPIAQSLTDPDQRAREIYGRFIEVLFPAFFILGTRGMIDFIAKSGSVAGVQGAESVRAVARSFGAPRATAPLMAPPITTGSSRDAFALRSLDPERRQAERRARGSATDAPVDGANAAPAPATRELSLVLLIVVFMAISFYPLTGYAISSAYRGFAFAWMARAVSLPVELLMVVLILPAVAALLLLLRRGVEAGRTAFALALSTVLGFHLLAFAVTLIGVVRVTQLRDGTIYRAGHWLAAHASPSTSVTYDADLGYGSQYFAYRFWSDARWQVVPPEGLAAGGADFVVTRRVLDLPLVTQEENGVRLYRVVPR